MPESPRFSDVLLQAVDQALLVPGEMVRAAIYERIERSFQVKREEIPEKLPLFQDALRELLGTAAKVMEKLIAKNLYSRLGIDFTDHAHWTLLEYVEHAKKATGGRWAYAPCSGAEEKV
jgi:hypothetical protein